MYHKNKKIFFVFSLTLIFCVAVLAAMSNKLQFVEASAKLHLSRKQQTEVCWTFQELRRNAEAQKLKNPETSNPESIEAGKKLYLRHCASCHGQGGKGDGGMALSGGTPSDLTDEKWDYGASDGEIFTSIREGVSADMLEYKNKLDDKQIWQVVNFLRSIGPQPAKEK